MDGASVYGYALGNPLRYTDPTGEFVPAAQIGGRNGGYAGRLIPPQRLLYELAEYTGDWILMEMDREIRKKIYVERLAYLDGRFEDELTADPEGYLKNIEARVLLAGRDIFGPHTPAYRFLESVAREGIPHPATFDAELLCRGTSRIDPNNAERVGRNLGYELLRVFEGDTEYFLEHSLSGLWEALEVAGMSLEDMGRYFERFDEAAG